MNLRATIPLLAGLLMLEGGALAQAPALDEPNAAQAAHEAHVETNVSVVATRLDQPETGATVRVLTREDIAQLPARSLPELLSELPGIDVRRRGAEGVQADIGIRGSDFNGTLILVDGEPMNDPQTNHLSADIDVPIDSIERIEVLYGAGSALYGSDAVGGVINIVTRGANLGRAQASCETRYAHGSNSLDAGGYRGAFKTSETLAFAVDSSRAESRGFRDDTEFSTKTLRLSSRLETKYGPVSASVGYAGREYGAFAFYGTAFPNQQETTRTRTARLGAELQLGGWTVTPSFSFRAHHDDYVLVRSNPAFYENRHDADRSTLRLFARHALLGGSLAFGAEGGRETIASTNLGAHGRNRGALFLEYGRSLLATRPGALNLDVGLRADSYEGFGTRLSPHAALSYSPSGRLRLRASAGTAFRIPTFLDLYYNDPQNKGNPDLRPERATNVEVGATYDTGVLRADAAFFNRHAVDLVDYVRFAPTDRYEARNVREADISGIEATLELKKPRVLAPVTRLALQATYVFTDLARLSAAADGATEGKYVLDPLHVKWDFIVGLRLPARTRLHSRLSYLSRPSFADGVWLLEARAGWQTLEGDILEVYLEGQNLGDVTYQERPGVPLPGRTIVAGLNLTW
ncbi:MAG: TonB-dependent receptor [Thermoanaerobaculia bacterium]